MNQNNTVYDDLGVPTVVNAVGTKTRISGTLIREEAADAMRKAANEFVRISDLQACASDVIADITGAEAGYVATGASAGLTLCAAACIAGKNLDVMAQLPNTDDVANEILIPKTHRNSYDRALRLAGAELIEVGNNDKTLGPGANNLTKWEIEAAITDQTAGIAYVARDELCLKSIIEIAHEYDIPVIVDAAGRLPPKKNLTAFVEKGADLVVFSGGKGVRGPQSTGIIAGRNDLVSSIALQHLDMDAVMETWDPPEQLVTPDELPGVPRHGLGRGFKVGKEEMVGLITALELYAAEDEAARFQEWHARALDIGDRLTEVDALKISYSGRDSPHEITNVIVEVDEKAAGQTAANLVLALRRNDPRIFVGDRNVENGIFTIDPMNLGEGDVDVLVNEINAALEYD